MSMTMRMIVKRGTRGRVPLHPGGTDVLPEDDEHGGAASEDDGAADRLAALYRDAATIKDFRVPAL